jgi:hypothetical protein
MTGKAERDKQNRKARTGLAVQDRQTGHAELVRQNSTGRSRQEERERKNVIGVTGQTDKTGRPG